MGQLNKHFINKHKLPAILSTSLLLIGMALFFFAAPLDVQAEENEDAKANLEEDNIDSTQDVPEPEVNNLEQNIEVEDENTSDEAEPQNEEETEENDAVNEEDENTATDESDQEDESNEEETSTDEEESTEDTDSDNAEESDAAEEEDATEDNESEEADESDEAEDEIDEDEQEEADGEEDEESEEANEDEDSDEADEEDESAEEEDEEKDKDKSKSTSTHSAKKKKELSKGDRDERVIQMKKDLIKAGFGGMNINDLFGSFTETRVSQFQKYYGLKATGRADNSTFNKLDSVVNSPLQESKRHKDTIQLKKQLNRAGFGGMNINDLYGSYTTKRVKDFQKKHGLKANGIADEVTLKKLNDIAPTSFKQGDRHKEIIQIKKDLTKLGFGNMNINDLYGSFTAKRVEQFQKYYGLKENSIVDTKTLDKLYTTANTSLQEGKRHKDTIELKNKLHKVGFGGMNINDLYGSYTAKRVKDFQKKHGLKITGIADDVTLDKINNVRPVYFEQGDRHQDIIQMKKDLTKLGFGNMNINNLYGSFTAKRVNQFQEYFNLKADGIADKTTQNKLSSNANTSLQEGKRNSKTLQLKKDLSKVGFGGMNINDLYGSYTAKRVKDFQKEYGLKVNGIADEVTLAKITSLAADASKKKVIYLDAGHGGSDPGASGNGLKEKDLTLDIAKRTKKQLEAMGYKVIMSRTTDSFPELSERTNEANKAKADIFVSIHINSCGGCGATGIETWKYNQGPKPNESNKLASNIQNEVIKSTKSRDRGVKDTNLHVNRESKMPSALVELGFIDTKADADKLKTASFKNKAAKGIANGIKKFFNG